MASVPGAPMRWSSPVKRVFYWFITNQAVLT
jgi:hypothetical protein